MNSDENKANQSANQETNKIKTFRDNKKHIPY